MRPVVATLAACGLVLTVLPVVALDATTNAAAEEATAQDVPMSREQRIQVQQGLAALGFDPGPADGLFGPKTRAAIWNWQNAKGLEATGFLTREEAEALGAMGQAADAYDEESDPQAADPDEPAFEERVPEPSRARNRVLYFPQCSGLDELSPDESGCWQAISNHQECDFFLPRMEFPARNEQFTWSGDCRHNAAHGKGTLKYDSEMGDGVHGTLSLSGEFVEGRQQGDWVSHARYSDGAEATLEGPFVDGELNGHWVIRSRHSDGTEKMLEGPYVDGDKNGRWVERYRYPDGTERTEEGTYVDGKWHGHWMLRERHPDGEESTFEVPHVDGVPHGHFVQRSRYPDGTEETHEVPYVNGERHGRYVLRSRYPDGTEDTVHFECHRDECE